MNENENAPYMFQDSIQGLDPQGLTHMVNIRAMTLEDFHAAIADFKKRNYFAGWKPLPIRQPGGGSGKPASTQEIKTWRDVPTCPKHNSICYPNAGRGKSEGKYFWNCPTCEQTLPFDQRERIGLCSSEQFAAYQRLDPADKPTKQTEEQGKTAGASRGTLNALKAARDSARASGKTVDPIDPSTLTEEAAQAELQRTLSLLTK